jgi:lipopolysaccharide biosynthesis protein
MKKLLRKWSAKGIRASIGRKKARWQRRVAALIGVDAAEKIFGKEDSGVAIDQSSSCKPDLAAYVKQILEQADPKSNRSDYYESARQIDLTGKTVKTIAFYLPQFHPIPENDRWWGKGFTEWTNVSKARPQFVGHHQPQLPADLGFYDLRSVDVLREQAAMARQFGVDAFCFHYYWFGGKRLLETPINNFVRAKDIDINFCYCWANENWTRRWDGREQDVLMAQNHSEEDDTNFIVAMLESFGDSRYIKINGRPLLIIYRIASLPNPKQTISLWRRVVKDAGFCDLYAVAARSLDDINPLDYGCDAAVEFPPHQTKPLDITLEVDFVNHNYKGAIHDYREVALRFGSQRSKDYRLFKTVMPGWDNEARKPGRGSSFIGNTPDGFGKWVELALGVMMDENPPEERILFINAWNEWGEGAHLEPDTKFGYAFLNKLADVLSGSGGAALKSGLINEINQKFERKSKVAVFVHVFYDDLVRPLVDDYLSCAFGKADFFISLGGNVSLDSIAYMKDHCVNLRIHSSENRGRDVKPFLEMLKVAKHLGYEIGFKVHGKKSPHRSDGSQLRNRLMYSLMGSPDTFDKNVDRLSKQNIGMLVPRGSMVDLSVEKYHAGNIIWLDHILKKLGFSEQIGQYNFVFSAGTMFAFRFPALVDFLDDKVFSSDKFESEEGQLDGTFAHAVERVLVFVATRRGYAYQEV